MTFEAKKDKLFSTIFYSLFLLLSIMIIVMMQGSDANKWLYVTVILVVLFIMIWMWYGTNYAINGIVLNIVSGPFKKTIPIRTIHKIEVGKTMWAGYKLGLSLNGLIIHYNKYDEIYITPVDSEKFIKQLKRVNKELQIEQVKN